MVALSSLRIDYMSERIQKYLASKGFGSRRQIERWLIDGKIRTIHGICQLGDRVSPKDILFVHGKKIEVDERKSPTRVLLYHKKSGEISTHRDPQNRPTLIQALPEIKDGRWIAVGRLDINTTGLILFSNDGELVHRLMHPSSSIRRVYLCRVWGDVNQHVLERLRKGVISKNEILKFDEIECRRKKGANRWFRIVLSRGRNREIHRAWKAVGYRVSRLKRIQYGTVSLPSDLKPGAWLELASYDVGQLRQLVNHSVR